MVEPDNAAAPWDRLEVWQEGAGVLRYEGSIRQWAWPFVRSVVGFAVLFVAVPDVLVLRSWSAVAGGTLAVGVWAVAALAVYLFQPVIHDGVGIPVPATGRPLARLDLPKA